MFTIAQLKFSFSSNFNLYERKRSNYLAFVFVEKNIKRIKLYEIERFIDKRQNARNEKYLL